MPTRSSTNAPGCRSRGWRCRVARLAEPISTGFTVGFLTDLHRSAMVSRDLIERAVDATLAQRPELIVLGGDYVICGNRDYVDSAAESLVAPAGPARGVRGARQPRRRPRHAGRAGATRRRGAEGRAHPGPTASRARRSRRGPVLDTPGRRDRPPRGPHAPGAHPARARPAAGEGGAGARLPPRAVRPHARRAGRPAGDSEPSRRGGSRWPKGMRCGTSTSLFVSRGIGTVYVPVRYRCPPEVALLTLRRASGADGQGEVSAGRCGRRSSAMNRRPLQPPRSERRARSPAGYRAVLLDEDPRGQRLFGVVVPDRDGHLQNDRPGIELGVDQVHRGAAHLRAVAQRLSLRVQSGKRRQQRRVDVEDRVRERRDERRSQQPHEARQAHQVDFVGAQRRNDGRIEGSPGRELTVIDHQRGHRRCPRAIESRGVADVGDDEGNRRVEGVRRRRTRGSPAGCFRGPRSARRGGGVPHRGAKGHSTYCDLASNRRRLRR